MFSLSFEGVQLADASQFGWRHRGNHFRGGAWENMKARAASGKDGAKDEEADALEHQRMREREWHRTREDVWMRI